MKQNSIRFIQRDKKVLYFHSVQFVIAIFEWNFLKNIIIRMDLVGVLPQEIEPVVVELKDFFVTEGFKRLNETTNNQFNVEISGSSLNDPTPQSHVSRTDNYKVYNFVDESRGISIDLSHIFVGITINSERYIKFENYSGYLLKIYEVLLEKIAFLSISRLGLRKINSCLFMEKDKISDCFSPIYFHFNSLTDNAEMLICDHKCILREDNKKINFAAVIQEGELEDKAKAYQVSLDIDAYIQDASRSWSDEQLRNELEQMNALIFNIYIKVLEPQFIELLSNNDSFTLEYLKGVESNE